MHVHADAIVDQQPSYPPDPVVFDRQTDDLAAFLDACALLRRRVHDDQDAQLDQAATALAAELARQGRRLARGPLAAAARRQVAFQRRRAADAELAGLRPSGRLLQQADAHDDAELYRRRETALGLLLSEDATSTAWLVPQVLADREHACRQQALLVDEQAQATRQLGRLRGLRGLLGQRRVRQLNAELGELDRQLHQVQAELARQQALLDAVQAAEDNRAAWLSQHQPALLAGAAAVVVVGRRLLRLANPPGCDRPVSDVDLDHPMGHDPLADATPAGTAAVVPLSPTPIQDPRAVVAAAAGQPASPTGPPGCG